ISVCEDFHHVAIHSNSCVQTHTSNIHTLANKSFTQAIFPSAFKYSQITPLLKKPNLDPTDAANYRPISNLSTIGKVIECLVQNRMRPPIIKSTSFSPFQSAHRPVFFTDT